MGPIWQPLSGGSADVGFAAARQPCSSVTQLRDVVSHVCVCVARSVENTIISAILELECFCSALRSSNSRYVCHIEQPIQRSPPLSLSLSLSLSLRERSILLY